MIRSLTENSMKTRSAFSLSLFDSQWTHMFAIMAGAGFFTRTGDNAPCGPTVIAS
jgi:hypothetical protein